MWDLILFMVFFSAYRLELKQYLTDDKYVSILIGITVTKMGYFEKIYSVKVCSLCVCVWCMCGARVCVCVCVHLGVLAAVA